LQNRTIRGVVLLLVYLALTSAPIVIAAPSPQAVGLAGQELTICKYDVTFRVVVDRASTAGTANGGTVVALTVRVTNTGVESGNTYLGARLRDESGRLFDMAGSSVDDVAVARRLGLQTAIGEIQPGLSARVLWVFIVAPDVRSLTVVPDNWSCSSNAAPDVSTPVYAPPPPPPTARPTRPPLPTVVVVPPAVASTATSVPTPVPPAATPTMPAGFSWSNGANWVTVSPNPDSSVATTETGALRIAAAPTNGGSDYFPTTSLNAPRVLQRVQGDWTVETRLNFAPFANYQGAGVMMCFDSAPESSGCRRIAERAFRPEDGGQVVRAIGSNVPFTSDVTYLRLRKEGTRYTGWYSSNGVDWTLGGQIDEQRSVQYLGLFAVRQPWDGNLDAYAVAEFTYFRAQAE
jgi:hypothetical protein